MRDIRRSCRGRRGAALAGLVVLGAAGPAVGDVRFWTNPDGGFFPSTTNWDDGSGPSPGIDDDLVFELEASYDVWLNDGMDRRHRSTSLRSGDVRLLWATASTSDVQMLESSGITPGLVVAESGPQFASLRMAGSSGSNRRDFDAPFVVVGDAPRGRGTLVLETIDTRLDVANTLWIGRLGRGDVEMWAGALARVGSLVLGSSPDVEGRLVIDGPAELEVLGAVQVGRRGQGRVEAGGGSLIETGDVILGQDPEARGDVTLEGDGTRWIVDGVLDVGLDGDGRILVANGADLIVTSALTVGGYAVPKSDPLVGATGTLEVRGAGASVVVSGPALMGLGGTGTIRVADGGRVELLEDLEVLADAGPSRLEIEIGPATLTEGTPIHVAGVLAPYEAQPSLAITYADGWIPPAGTTLTLIESGGPIGLGDVALPDPVPGLRVIGPTFADGAVTLELDADPDLDADGTIGVEDLIVLLAAWGPCPLDAFCRGDLDADGAVGLEDLIALLGAWS